MNEQSPLLNRHRSDSALSRFTLELRVVKLFIKKRFWWLCLLGLAAIAVLNLSFLPRTSCNRDFRRWHNLHFTEPEVKRIFLVRTQLGVPGPNGHTIEENIDRWLKGFAAVNANSPTALAALALAALKALLTHVLSQMRLLHFSPHAHTYPVSAKLQTPVLLALDLVDRVLARVLYRAQLLEPDSKTPAFFAYSKAGAVQAPFVYARHGSADDLALLDKHKVLLEGKVVLFAHDPHSKYSLEDKVAMVEQRGCAGVVVMGLEDAPDAISRSFKGDAATDVRFRLPISYKDAQPILQALDQAKGPFAQWKYSPTPENLELRLASSFVDDRLNVTNIVAAIDGVLHDSEIVIGASRDIYTSHNPMSGHAILLEVMRQLKNLQRMGWRPLRTIRFVLWDASRSGALGSLESIRDPAVFKANMPVLAYINLDEDAVIGSHFSADASPLLNHNLRKIAKLIPFLGDLPYYKRLFKDEPPEENALLHKFWLRQDNMTINNRLGYAIAGKDAATFQMGFHTPTLNVKFGRSPHFNDSLYVAESNVYSQKWLENELDPQLDLHGLLVRLLGLFALSLSEHEVVHTRTRTYFAEVDHFFGDLTHDNERLIAAWADRRVDLAKLAKFSIYGDLEEREKTDIKFHDIWQQMTLLLMKTLRQAEVYDRYNEDVADLWRRDFPWYKMLRKVHIYAKAKVASYKLLRFEKNLNQVAVPGEADDDDEKLRHFMYDVPQGVRPVAEKRRRGAFGRIYEAFDREDMDAVVVLVASRYERLKSAYKKIT